MIHPLVVEYGSILAAAAGCVCLWREGVANPFDVPVPVGPGIDADDIESCHVGREGRAHCEEHLSGPDKLDLLATVDGQSSARELAGGAITNFDKYQAIVVQHHEVDLTVAATVVALNRLQSPVSEVSIRELLDCAA